MVTGNHLRCIECRARTVEVMKRTKLYKSPRGIANADFAIRPHIHFQRSRPLTQHYIQPPPQPETFTLPRTSLARIIGIDSLDLVTQNPTNPTVLSHLHTLNPSICRVEVRPT
jgi:hypothetical protein